jgi:hypothetical protein
MGIFELLRDRILLADIAGRFTELKRSGSGHGGCCPLPNHQDSTPSFYVYADDRAHCFGCGFHGDVIDLWAAIHNLQPIEAALDLAREYSIQLPDRDPQVQKKAEERRKKEADYIRQAQACHQQLARQPHVAQWWLQRGFYEDLQREYLLGSNRDGSAAVIPYWQRTYTRSKGSLTRSPLPLWDGAPSPSVVLQSASTKKKNSPGCAPKLSISFLMPTSGAQKLGADGRTNSFPWPGCVPPSTARAVRISLTCLPLKASKPGRH